MLVRIGTTPLYCLWNDYVGNRIVSAMREGSQDRVVTSQGPEAETCYVSKLGYKLRIIQLNHPQPFPYVFGEIWNRYSGFASLSVCLQLHNILCRIVESLIQCPVLDRQRLFYLLCIQPDRHDDLIIVLGDFPL